VQAQSVWKVWSVVPLKAGIGYNWRGFKIFVDFLTDVFLVSLPHLLRLTPLFGYRTFIMKILVTRKLNFLWNLLF